jgi:thiamine pyrophosphate-dependent acetolactate synthase large subunit-like protein
MMPTTGEVVRTVLQIAGSEDRIVASTGFLARHLYHYAGDSDCCFYMIGSMGLAMALGSGIVAAAPATRVIVLDGDGSFLMGLPSLCMAGDLQPVPLHQVVIANGCYASTGGQALPGRSADLVALALGSGYARATRVTDREQLLEAAADLWAQAGPTLLLVHTREGESAPPRVALGPEAIQAAFRRRFLAGRSGHARADQ